MTSLTPDDLRKSLSSPPSFPGHDPGSLDSPPTNADAASDQLRADADDGAGADDGGGGGGGGAGGATAAGSTAAEEAGAAEAAPAAESTKVDWQRFDLDVFSFDKEGLKVRAWVWVGLAVKELAVVMVCGALIFTSNKNLTNYLPTLPLGPHPQPAGHSAANHAGRWAGERPGGAAP